MLTAYGPSMGTTINAIPVRLARGDAKIGFRQISELKPVEGIDIVGMGCKRLANVEHHLCIPCCIASSTITASASAIVVHFQNSSGLRSINGVEDVERYFALG